MDAPLPSDPVVGSTSDVRDAPQVVSTESPAESSTLSKNAQKKARKAALFAERKLERRAREKEAKKEKKRLRADKIAAGEEIPDEPPKKRTKLNGPKTPFNARVVTDLGFDDKMSEKEVKSLCSQLAYTYSANRNSQTPFSSLLFTSLNGRTFTRLESMNDAGYKRWIGTEWWGESYDRLWLDEKPESSSEEPAPEQQADGETTQKALASKESVVYLTADSVEELSELKEGETYIIGGICDHNRYKNLCLDKATDSGIRAAQLPIGRYLAHLPTRKVLTVNQVFEILLKWVETRDWEQAFYAVIPKRKFQNGKPQEDVDDDDAQAEGEGGELQDEEVNTEKTKEENEQTS